MDPNKEALDGLHKHLADWQAGSDALVDSAELPSIPDEQDPAALAASIRRGRPKPISVTMGKPQIVPEGPVDDENVFGINGTKVSRADMTDDDWKTAQDAAKKAPYTPAAPGASNSPRGVMASMAMGAKPPPAVDTSKPLGFHDDAMESAVASDRHSGAMGDLGKAVTAFTERPSNELDAIQQLGGVHPSARQHNPIWDKTEGTAVADLTRQRTSAANSAAAAEKKDPNSTTAKTYRAVLKKLAPDLQLEGATADQIEKMVPWIEKFAAENADALKAQLAAANKKEADARHDKEHAETAADRRLTHADAQANAAAMRGLAADRMKTEAEAKDQAGAQHLGDKAGEGQSAARALDDIDATIAKSPDDIPGVGKYKSMVPDFLKPTVLSDEGMSVRNNARDVLGILLHKRSGAAVSPAELSRYEQMYGLNGSDSQFKEGMARMRRDYASELAATQAGVSSGAKQKFKAAGGSLAEDIAAKGSPATGKPSPGAGYVRGTVDGKPGWVNQDAGEWEPD